MRRSNPSPVLLLLLTTALAMAAVPSFASGEAPADGDAVRTMDCAPTLPQAPAAAPACTLDEQPPQDALFSTPLEQKGPPLRRYCKCGCGITCETDADCGPGGSCVAFVTCC